MGWYQDKECTKKIPTTITIDKNLTFYAKWKQQFSYTLSSGKASITGLLSFVTINGVKQTDITLPSTIDGYPITKIGYKAFNNCTSLTSITIPNSVTDIIEGAFNNCTGLISVTTIGDYSFKDCNKLTSVTIPDSVKIIESCAFSGCQKLTEAIIGNNVNSIEGKAFYNCSSLTDVYYTGTEEDWKKISIGSNNTYLKNAAKHYNYIIKDKDKLYFNKADNKAEIESQNAISNAVLIFSLYKDDMLVDIKTQNVSVKEGENKFENLISDYQNADIMKIMIWDNLKEMSTPFSAYETKLN